MPDRRIGKIVDLTLSSRLIDLDRGAEAVLPDLLSHQVGLSQDFRLLVSAPVADYPHQNDLDIVVFALLVNATFPAAVLARLKNAGDLEKAS